jgi:NAD(P)-dependent dehydrogenase (short-subunit alcohol dehydrogenase family)
VTNGAASEFGLSGRTYIVPGAGRGLGRTIALAIAAADGPLDGIVHAAGTQYRAPATAVPVAAWRDLMAIHLDAPFFLSTALHRDQLRDGRPGAHVFIGSLTSARGIANIAPYAAAKSALLGVIRTLAVEWAASGTRVNGIAPGYFRTELTADLFADPDRAAWVLDRVPMGRLGDPADLAGAVVFLLSPASGYITGQLLPVDGGWLAG